MFFYAYRQWFAWLVLVAVLCLPVFSLLVSLPAMLTARLVIRAPKTMTAGTEGELELRCRCRLPVPLWKCRVSLERPITGESWNMEPGAHLPAQHCGALICTVEKAKIYDYLGLFSLPLRGQWQAKVLVRPVAVPMGTIPELERYLSRAWRPKRGGGFAENHELRLYRPGDQIQQIHWKLSAKTNRLILREPMEPLRGRMVLRLDLNGTAQELDRKLGRLLWLGGELLEKKLSYEIRCMTASGVESRKVDSQKSLMDAMDLLLSSGFAPGGSTIRDKEEHGCWLYEIGGGPDEG